MFRTWRERGKTPIGIDFGARAVRAVQLAWSRDQWRVTAAAVAALPSDVLPATPEHSRATASALVAALEQGGFTGRAVVTALPSFAVQYKNLRLPQMPPNELRAAVEWEAADRLKLGQTYQIQYFDAGEVRLGDDLRQEIIMIASPTAFVEQHVNLLTSCGLDPQAVDVDASALARCAAGCGHDKLGESHLILDLGVSGSNVLICRQGRVMFFKRIEIGGRHVEDALVRQFNLPAAEAGHLLADRAALDEAESSTSAAAAPAMLVGGTRRDLTSLAIGDAIRPVLTDLAREVSLCLRYQGVTFRGQRAGLGLLTGGAPDPLLPDILTQESGMTIERLDTTAVFDWSRISETTMALCPPRAWAVALGLALREQDQMPARGVA